MKKWTNARIEKGDLVLPVVTSGAIAGAGILNGRLVPVVFVSKDSAIKIDNLIAVHRAVPTGNCISRWGFLRGKDKVLLRLEFADPVNETCILLFDVITQGSVVDQILYARCFYLMTGDADSKLSQHLDDPRILVEVAIDSFIPEWEKVFQPKYVQYLKRKYKVSTSTALEIFEKMRNEFKKLKTMRMQ
jgi:hypothetical protein